MKLKKFDYQINSNKKRVITLASLGCLIFLLFVTLIIYKSFANYKVTESYNIIKGKVISFTRDPQVIYYMLVDEEGDVLSTDQIPSQEEYEYDSGRSSCLNGSTLLYDAENNTLSISAENDEVCKAYFNYIEEEV